MHAQAGNARGTGEAPAGRWTALADAVLAQQERWPLWIPVLLGGGIALYFVLAHEPPRWSGPAALGAVAVAAAMFRRSQPVLLAALATCAVAVGFSLAQYRAHVVAAPVIEGRIGPTVVGGRIVAVDGGGSYRRVVLDQVSVGRLPEARTPARVRIRLNGVEPRLRPGDRISARAILMPPPAPSAPGAYDFQRRAWFERLGAVGFALGPPELVAAGDGWEAALWLERLRQGMHRSILDAAPGASGAVASALLTGERDAIPE